MGFEKMIKNKPASHKSWRNLILSIKKNVNRYVLKICFRESFIKQLGILPTDKIDIFIGVDNDERKLMIVKGSTYVIQNRDNVRTLTVTVGLLEGFNQFSIKYQECPFVINGGAVVIEIPDIFYTYKSNKKFNVKHYHPILKPHQVRYMKAMCADPEIHRQLKVPGFTEKMIPGDLGNLKGKI